MMEGIEGIEGIAGLKKESDQTLESTALAGAAAIQRIIAERDSLRNVTSSQQRQIMRLRGTNEDLQRRMLQIRQHYLELATEILGRFEKFDGALQEALRDPPADSSAKNDDRLVDLAQRLAPTGGRTDNGGRI
jgi:predicted  nucleic acid-binding Zn-ribbon protein